MGRFEQRMRPLQRQQSCLAGEGSEGFGSSTLTLSRPLKEKYLAEWLWDLQDEPFQYTAILCAILEIPKSLSNRREQRRDQNRFCAVAKRW